jgi:hypothetical protein
MPSVTAVQPAIDVSKITNINPIEAALAIQIPLGR